MAEDVIGIVEKYDAEVMQIKPVFDLLLAKRPEINSLMAPKSIDPVRLQLNTMIEKMVLHASAIKSKVRLAAKTLDPRDLLVINAAIQQHLLYLHSSKNPKVLNQKIDGFLYDVKTDTELTDVIEELSLGNDVIELNLALNTVRETSGKRIARLSKRPLRSSREIMKTVVDAVYDVFKEIEVAHLRNRELDYEPMVNELNVVMYKYRLSITLREHSNKRKAALKNGTQTDEETNGTEGSAENDASTQVDTTAMNGNGAYETSEVHDAFINHMDIPVGPTCSLESRADYEKSMGTKKAVDLSWGTTQQPSRNGNA